MCVLTRLKISGNDGTEEIGSVTLILDCRLASKRNKAWTMRMILGIYSGSLLWCHNGRDGVSNHQPRDCLLYLHSGADQRKHQSSASLAFLRGIHRWPVNSPHKWPVTRKMFLIDDVIMWPCRKYSKFRQRICFHHKTFCKSQWPCV